MEVQNLNPANTSSSIDRDKNLKSLIARKKLHLVLDLDNTLLHSEETLNLTSYDQNYLKRPECQRWIKEGKLYQWDIQGNTHNYKGLTKLRPNVQTFLKEASKLFDFSIFTLGTLEYATKMVQILDPHKLYFANSQVLTREKCIVPSTKSLDLVLQHERVVLVVDDTKHCWNNKNDTNTKNNDTIKNLIEIGRYEFFDDKSSRNNKKSWTRRWQDESEKYGELARVLRELKKIHYEFYNNEEFEEGEEDYECRDVREAIQKVKRKFKLIGTKEGNKEFMGRHVREIVVK